MLIEIELLSIRENGYVIDRPSDHVTDNSLPPNEKVPVCSLFGESFITTVTEFPENVHVLTALSQVPERLFPPHATSNVNSIAPIETYDIALFILTSKSLDTISPQ